MRQAGEVEHRVAGYAERGVALARELDDGADRFRDAAQQRGALERRRHDIDVLGTQVIGDGCGDGADRGSWSLLETIERAESEQ